MKQMKTLTSISNKEFVDNPRTVQQWYVCHVQCTIKAQIKELW